MVNIAGNTPDSTTTTKGKLQLAGDLAGTAASPNVRRMTDANGNELLLTATAASAVNEVTIGNAITLSSPTIAATGGDTNISLNLVSKGAGSILANNTLIATANNSLTLSNKSIDATTNTVTNVSNLSVKRQNDTTNTTVTGAKMETGWGVVTNNTASNSISEAITFSAAFSTIPIVTVTCGGDNASSTTYGSGGVNLAAGIVSQAVGPSTTGFTVLLAKRDSTNFATGFTFYQWIAIGA